MTEQAADLQGRTDWRRLRRCVRGRVFLPGDPGFRGHTELFNQRYHDKRPAAVLSVADVADVRRAIVWARDNRIPVVARSGGHSFAGYSVNDGLVLDLGRLGGVHADESTGIMTAGGGARVAQLHDAGQAYELALPTGTSPAVGVAGLALGGGAGYISRKFGLTADAMVETTVVTAAGELVHCSATENPDLFWACRGGGGGNFGVNVSFTFQGRPVPAVSTFAFTWRWSDAVKVLTAAQDVLRQAPDEFAIRMGVSSHGIDRAAARRNATVTAVGQFLGPSGELADILDPVLSLATPVHQEIVDRTYWDANRVMGHATSAQRFAMRTRFAKEPLSEQGIDTVLSWVERWPGSSNPDGGGVGMFSWGGRINRTPPAETAFVHRDTLLLASIDTSWTVSDPADRIEANLRWLNGLYDALGPYLSGSAYQNFPDPELVDWRRAYYGANFDRLVDVKTAYDPDGVFHFDQGVRP